jgi:hypothetical protein
VPDASSSCVSHPGGKVVGGAGAFFFCSFSLSSLSEPELELEEEDEDEDEDAAEPLEALLAFDEALSSLSLLSSFGFGFVPGGGGGGAPPGLC